MDKDVFRVLRYSFVFAIVIFIAFLVSFFIIFNTFFVIEKGEAVPTGGAGITNVYKYPGDIDVDTGKIYLGATTTPALGIHDEHGVLYPKSDTFIYYLYDKTGETERKLIYEDENGDVVITRNLSATNVGSVGAFISAIYATLGSFTTCEAGTANITTANVATINNTTLNVSEIKTTDFQGYEKSADPPNPIEGHYKIWMSNGTGSGDDGDIMIKIQAGSVVKTGTLVDFSAL